MQFISHMVLKDFRRLLVPSATCLCRHPFLNILKCNQAPIFALLEKGLPNHVFKKVNEVSPVIYPLRDYKNRFQSQIIQRENVWTIPNILCISRIIVTPYIGHLIINADFTLAFYIMLCAGLTDLLDGFIARNWYNQSTKLGSFLDPMADKILIVTVFTAMTYSNIIPTMLTAIIIARDVSLASAAFYIRYLSLPPPKTLSRYFDISHATAQLAPTAISKFNTVIQLMTVGVTLTGSAFNCIDHPTLQFFWYLTAVTTIASAVSYLVSKNTYKILSNSHSKK